MRLTKVILGKVETHTFKHTVLEPTGEVGTVWKKSSIRVPEVLTGEGSSRREHGCPALLGEQVHTSLSRR